MANHLARRLAEAVSAHGAPVAFGVPGGGPNLDVVGALADSGVRFVLAHGESAAAMMASSYGLLTGRPALALATRGPGAAAAVNGTAQATLDRAPLLLVTDAVSRADLGRVAHQRLDQTALFAPVTKWSGTLGRRAPAVTAAGALALAAAWPPGAVHLDYDPTADGDDVPAPPAPQAPSDDDLRRAADLLAGARHPVVIVGRGALPWWRPVRAQLGRLGWPVLTTYEALGAVDSEGEAAAGLFTGGASERPLLEQADVVLAVGLDPVEPIPTRWRYDAAVVSLHPSPLVERYLPVDVELTGPTGPLLERVAPARSAAAWPPAAGAARRDAVRDALSAWPGHRFGPVDVTAAVATACPPGTTATVDAGAHFLAIMPFWAADEPHMLLISNGLATMGYALPAAIGTALARRGRPVVCLVGDGGLGMVLAELETLARLALPVTVVVFDDAGLSLIRVKQRADQGGEEAVGYGAVDFAAVARAVGLRAEAVDDAAALRVALDGPWDRPRLVDARIDPSSYAHLLRVTRG